MMERLDQVIAHFTSAHDKASVSIVSKNNGVAIIRIDYPPANGWNDITSKGVFDAYTQACNDPEMKAIVITGSGKNFVAGADITRLQAQQRDPSVTKEQIVSNIFRGHEMINKLETGPKPTVAAINGFALGGGLELAMALNGRVAVPSASVGLPEVTLGIIPGLAGTQRLWRLIGVDKAVQLTTSGKHVKAADALKMGLIDQVVPPEQLLNAASKLALEIAAGKKPRRISSQLNGNITDKNAVLQSLEAARVEVAKKSRGQPQQVAVVDSIRAGIEGGFEAGIKKEAQLFSELITGPVSAALVNTFFASRATSKLKGVPEKPSGKPIRTVLVVGGGTMGAGIVIAYLLNGYNVILKEVNYQLLEKAMERILDNVSRVLKKRKLPEFGAETVLRNLRTTTGSDFYGEVDLVIEAVIENLALKQRIFKELAENLPRHAILATNTSTIDIVKIGAQTNALDRVVGLHFFSPAHIMPLLEIVRSQHTSQEVLSQCLAMSKVIKKTPVVSMSTPGFIANRLFFPYGQAAVFLVDAGISPYAIDKAVVAFGMPMGPFRMGDLSGVDVGRNAGLTFVEAYPDRVYKSNLAQYLVEANMLGEKSGQGYYRYQAHKPVPDEKAIQQYVERSRADARKNGVPDLSKAGLTERDIQDILFYPVVNEGARIAGEGVAQSVGDIDVAAIMGYGYPSHKGGPMFWGASKHAGQGGGYRHVAERLTYFAATFGSIPSLKQFFSPSNELLDLAKKQHE